MTAELHVLREHTVRDVPAILRELAASIEAGDYGRPRGCVVVLDADRLTVSYMGDGEAGPSAHLLLSAGAAKIIRAVLESRT